MKWNSNKLSRNSQGLMKHYAFLLFSHFQIEKCAFHWNQLLSFGLIIKYGLSIERLIQKSVALRFTSVWYLYICSFAAPSLAASWDNVGVLVEPTPPHRVNTVLLTNDLTIPVMEVALQHKVRSLRCHLGVDSEFSFEWDTKYNKVAPGSTYVGILYMIFERCHLSKTNIS